VLTMKTRMRKNLRRTNPNPRRRTTPRRTSPLSAPQLLALDWVLEKEKVSARLLCLCNQPQAKWARAVEAQTCHKSLALREMHSKRSSFATARRSEAESNYVKRACLSPPHLVGELSLARIPRKETCPQEAMRSRLLRVPPGWKLTRATSWATDICRLLVDHMSEASTCTPS